MARQVTFFDEALRPDSPQDLLFFQQPAVAFNEDEEKIEGFGGQRHDFAVA
ncbi:MAG TPA: hypothetical protein VHQ95_25105 [Pyrinomonadaceae bacterium]|nr:hypothetical protein [Pyrinomonadaceae bacterium]